MVIKEGIVRAFHNLLLEQGEWRPSIRNMMFQTLDVQDAEKLKVPFQEEVLAALSDLKGNKAPGPDRFSLVYW